MNVKHGTRWAYGQGCPCGPCHQAQTAYDTTRYHAIKAGTWQGLTDATATRNHVLKLLTLGHSKKGIARAAGLTHVAIIHLASNNPPKNVLPRTAAGILTIPLTVAPPRPTPARTAPSQPKRTRFGGPSIPVDGTRRRIRSLAAAGWSIRHQAERMNASPSTLVDIARGRTTQVRADIADAVASLFRELHMVPLPTSSEAIRVRTNALAQGWLPPFAFEEDCLDLTDAEMDAEMRRRAQQMTVDELRLCQLGYQKGERSPLIVAGYLERRRQLTRRAAERSAGRLQVAA
ncbi:hypothetical protein [Allonocardiopsis opalescens]|uniref:Helix-turn-helix protein n=1 Tax=Allonocardiopsis opalescens TaxID=1144618 RepID=A0A2T0PP70_9ACTN|nr:hypothetical protein [Allonocardiopsis opalescens]PRX90677.1 hypothetical protein CLV72_11815 [Allonocardiopsis opalescens]